MIVRVVSLESTCLLHRVVELTGVKLTVSLLMLQPFLEVMKGRSSCGVLKWRRRATSAAGSVDELVNDCSMQSAISDRIVLVSSVMKKAYCWAGMLEPARNTFE